MSDRVQPLYANIENAVYNVHYRDDGSFVQGELNFTCTSDNDAGAAVIMLNRLTEVLKAAEEMRRYQRQYFKTRDNRALQASKLAERRFDSLIKLIS